MECMQLMQPKLTTSHINMNIFVVAVAERTAILVGKSGTSNHAISLCMLALLTRMPTIINNSHLFCHAVKVVAECHAPVLRREVVR